MATAHKRNLFCVRDANRANMLEETAVITFLSDSLHHARRAECRLFLANHSFLNTWSSDGELSPTESPPVHLSPKNRMKIDYVNERNGVYFKVLGQKWALTGAQPALKQQGSLVRRRKEELWGVATWLTLISGNHWTNAPPLLMNFKHVGQ